MSTTQITTSGNYFQASSSNYALIMAQEQKTKKKILSTLAAFVAVVSAGVSVATNAPTVKAESSVNFLLTRTSPSTRPHLKTIKKLRDFGLYRENWDGYKGHPPSSEAIEDAVNVLWSLPVNIPSPQATLSGDGEVGLLWRNGEVYIDIGFYGDGHYSYYAKDAQGHEHFGDNLSVTDSFTHIIVKILNQT